MAAKHIHSEAIEFGNDGIADYSVCVHPGDQTRPHCTKCNNLSTVTVMYRDSNSGITVGLMRRWGLNVENTLLRSAKNWLCLSCWARFQRQVTHVAEKGADKGLNAA